MNNCIIIALLLRQANTIGMVEAARSHFSILSFHVLTTHFRENIVLLGYSFLCPQPKRQHKNEQKSRVYLFEFCRGEKIVTTLLPKIL